MEDNLKVLAEMLMKASAANKADGPSVEDKMKLLQAIASRTADGAKARSEYIESRAEVLLPLIEVQSTARKIFTPEVLGPTGQAEYPINFDYTEVGAWLPKIGSVVTRITEGDSIIIPTFGIEGGVRYSMDIAAQGRLDIAAQQMELLKNRIVAKEELAAWQTVRGVFSGLNSNQTVYCSGSSENFHSFSKKAVNKMQVQMDVQRRVLTDVFASPVSLGDIREWSQTTIDYLTQREIFQNAGLPDNKMWNIRFNKVYDSNLVGNDAAWGFDSRTFGKMPITYNLQTYEDPTAILKWEVGVFGREKVGFGVTDTWAVVKAVMDSTHVGTACSSL